MAFDIIGAKKAGYNDTEIADFLSNEQGLDAAAARKAGYSDQEIIGQLSAGVEVGSDAPPKAAEPSVLEKVKKFATDAVAPVPAQVVAGWKKGVGGMDRWLGENVVQPVSDTFGDKDNSNWLTRAGTSLYDEGKAIEEGANLTYPVDPQSAAGYTRGALTSIGQQLPLMGVGMAAAPVAGVANAARIPLAGMAAQTAGESYGDYREAGVGKVGSTLAAAAKGGLEYATEKFPTEQLFKAVSQPVLSTLGKMAVGELGGEEVAYLTQTMIDKGYLKADPQTGQLSPNQTNAEVLDGITKFFSSGEASQGMKDTFWTTLIQTGVMGTAAKGVNTVANMGQPKAAPAGPLSRAVANADPAEVIPPEPSLSEMVAGRRTAERGMSAPAKETATTPSVKYRPFNAVTSRRKGMAAPAENVAAEPNFTLQGGVADHVTPEVMAPEVQKAIGYNAPVIDTTAEEVAVTPEVSYPGVMVEEQKRLPQPVIDTTASDVVTRSKPAPSPIGEMVGKSRNRVPTVPANDGVAPAEAPAQQAEEVTPAPQEEAAAPVDAPAPLKGLEPRQLSSLEKNANRTPAMEKRYQELKGRQEAQAPVEVAPAPVAKRDPPKAKVDPPALPPKVQKQIDEIVAGSFAASETPISKEAVETKYKEIKEQQGEDAALAALAATHSKFKGWHKEAQARTVNRIKAEIMGKYGSTPSAAKDIVKAVQSGEIDITGLPAENDFRAAYGLTAPEAQTPAVPPPSPKAAATEQGEGEKEPWEMTRDEFLGIGTVGKSPYEKMIGATDDRRWREQDRNTGGATHKWQVVKAALDEGKPVPPEVLKDYPDLQPQPKKTEVKATQVEAPAPADPTATRRAILTRLSSPKRLKDRLVQSLAADHGKETVNALVKEGMVRFPGQGRAEITKAGEKWLAENAPPPKVKTKKAKKPKVETEAVGAPAFALAKEHPKEADYQAALTAGKKREALRILHDALGIKDVDASVDRDGAHSPSGPEEGSPLYDVAENGVYPEDVYSANGLRYYGTGDDAMDREAYNLIKTFEAHPNRPVTIYRAVYKDEGNTINPGDWVTTVRAYAKEHGEGALNGEFKIIKKQVYARDIFTSGDSWLEWGYHPQEFKPEIPKGETKLSPLADRVAAWNSRGQFALPNGDGGTLSPSAISRIESLIAKALPEGSVTVNVVPSIEPPPGSERAFAAHGVKTGKVAGMVQAERDLTTGDVRTIITLSMDGATEQTAWHELEHVGEALGIITEKDLSILSRAYPDKDGVASSERRADAFADYVAGKSKPVLSAKLVFDKVRKFLERLANVLKGQGWRTADDVFADLMEGKLKRNAKDAGGTEGVQFSAKDQTETPAFAKWFGKSKVVDAEGKPLVVYHGTDADFSVFKEVTDGFNWYGKGIYFTDKPSLAENWASNKKGGPAVMPVYLSLQNPLRVTVDEYDDFIEKSFSKEQLESGDLTMDDVQQAVKSAGHDSVIVELETAGDIAGLPIGTKHKEYIAFTTTQIKSAIGNNGDFGPSNPDIRFSLASAYRTRDPQALRSALTLHPKVQGLVASVMNEGANVTRWQKTVGTMYHMAEKLAAEGKPQFKAVFMKGQEFLNDVSALAVAAESLAPDIFPKLGTGKGIFHYLSKADSKAIAAPLFEGTLYGGADPVKGKVFSDVELERIFKLNPKQIDLYRQARAATDRSLDDMARSLIAKNAKMVKLPYDRDMGLKEMAEEVTAAIQERVDDMQAELDRAEKEHEAAIDGLSGKELKEAVKAYEKFARPQQAAIDLHKSAIENVKEIARKTTLLKSRGYFPLMRFGDMTVTVKDKDGKVQFFGMYESTYKAKQAQLQLEKEYPKDTVTMAPLGKEKYKLFGGMNLEALQLFAEHLDAEEAAPYQEYLKVGLNNRSAMKRLIHRKGTEGYSEDAVRTLAQFIVSNARHASTQYNLHDMQKLVTAIPDQEQADVQDQAVKLYEYLTKPNEEAAKLRGYLFVHYLGGSLASGIVNMTQPIMMTAPYLATKTTPAKVVKFMTAASKMSYTDPAKIQGALGIALRRAEADGITAPQEIHQLTAMASNKLLAANPVWNAALKGWGGFFAAAEAFNRRITFISAFNIAKDNGRADSAAYREAADAVTATQGLYNKGNRANWSRGIIGATAMTFKQYSVMYLELYNRLPMKQKLIMMGLLMFMAGLQGMPFAEDAEDVVDTLGQWAGYSTNSRQWMERTADKVYGGNFLLRGVSSVLPIDLQGRMGLQNLIPGTALLKQSEIDKGRDVAEFFGPAGGLLKSLGDTLSLAATGLYGRATVAALPRAAQNIIQGVEMMATGAGHDKYGRKTVEVNKAEAAVKMTGFNPDRIAEESRVKGSNMQDLNLVRVRKNEIVNQWAYGIVNKDRAEIQEAIKKLKEWNAKNPDWRITNALSAAQKKAQALRATSKDRFIKSVPKEQRRRIVDELG